MSSLHVSMHGCQITKHSHIEVSVVETPSKQPNQCKNTSVIIPLMSLLTSVIENECEKMESYCMRWKKYVPRSIHPLPTISMKIAGFLFNLIFQLQTWQQWQKAHWNWQCCDTKLEMKEQRNFLLLSHHFICLNSSNFSHGSALYIFASLRQFHPSVLGLNPPLRLCQSSWEDNGETSCVSPQLQNVLTTKQNFEKQSFACKKEKEKRFALKCGLHQFTGWQKLSKVSDCSSTGSIDINRHWQWLHPVGSHLCRLASSWASTVCTSTVRHRDKGVDMHMLDGTQKCAHGEKMHQTKSNRN